MALQNCPECNNQVSESALNCPQCGAKLRKAKRGFMGKLFKWGFIVFNVLMLIWLVTGMGAATEGVEAMSEAEQAGAAIGTGIGMTLILGLWVMGDIILGTLVLFTRPR